MNGPVNWCKYWTFFIAIIIVIMAIGNCQKHPEEFIAPLGGLFLFLWILMSAWLWLWSSDHHEKHHEPRDK